jgi:hypothetical protein
MRKHVTFVFLNLASSVNLTLTLMTNRAFEQPNF